jgi:pullulanase
MYKKLGATLDDNGVLFCLWSPDIKRCKVFIYDKDNSNKELNSFYMNKNGEYWEFYLENSKMGVYSLDGYFYQYEIELQNGEKRRGLDPYAKSMAGFNPHSDDKIGKAAIVDMNSERAGEKDKSIGMGNLKNSLELIAYEVHVRDFTINTDVEGKGTFLGFANYNEGIEHLKKLGITHVQFLPIQNYYTVNEGDKGFRDSGGKYYNWGYDPHNYFTLEGWLSTDEQDPYARIREFRHLVKKLHENGIGVIVDVVYNHTYGYDIFENIAPGKYYRYDKDGKISLKSGAGPSLETRNEMVRKLIVDSLKFFVDEYGVDGFRFDLMGFIDTKTMREIRKALGDNIILHGEAWNFTDLDVKEAPIKGFPEYYPLGIDLAMFNDTTRDAYAGRMENKGFVQGDYSLAPICRTGIIGNLVYFDNGGEELEIDKDIYNRFAHSPNEVLQYLSIHDGFTLWDKINLSFKGSKEDKIKILKQASAMLFTSQGKIIIHGGVEIARTKPLAKDDPESNRAHTSENIIELDDTLGIKHFHENTYASSDFVNMYRWNRKNDKDFKGVYEYYCGLIKMRRAIKGFRYQYAESIQKAVRFIDKDMSIDNNKYIAYIIDNSLEKDNIDETNFEKLMVIHNVKSEELIIKNMFIDKNTKLILDGEKAGVEHIKDSKVIIKDGEVIIPAHTSVVLAK